MNKIMAKWCITHNSCNCSCNDKIEIDDDIADVIIKLNKDICKTKYSCSGHNAKDNLCIVFNTWDIRSRTKKYNDFIENLISKGAKYTKSWKALYVPYSSNEERDKIINYILNY